MLHEHAPEIAHGAIAAERVIVTPAARIIVVEHVLGSAIGELKYSSERYWKELRIAVPAAAPQAAVRPSIGCHPDRRRRPVADPRPAAAPRGDAWTARRRRRVVVGELRARRPRAAARRAARLVDARAAARSEEPVRVRRRCAGGSRTGARRERLPRRAGDRSRRFSRSSAPPTNRSPRRAAAACAAPDRPVGADHGQVPQGLSAFADDSMQREAAPRRDERDAVKSADRTADAMRASRERRAPHRKLGGAGFWQSPCIRRRRPRPGATRGEARRCATTTKCTPRIAPSTPARHIGTAVGADIRRQAYRPADRAGEPVDLEVTPLAQTFGPRPRRRRRAGSGEPRPRASSAIRCRVHGRHRLVTTRKPSLTHRSRRRQRRSAARFRFQTSATRPSPSRTTKPAATREVVAAGRGGGVGGGCRRRRPCRAALHSARPPSCRPMAR